MRAVRSCSRRPGKDGSQARIADADSETGSNNKFSETGLHLNGKWFDMVASSKRSFFRDMPIGAGAANRPRSFLKMVPYRTERCVRSLGLGLFRCCSGCARGKGGTGGGSIMSSTRTVCREQGWSAVGKRQCRR